MPWLKRGGARRCASRRAARGRRRPRGRGSPRRAAARAAVRGARDGRPFAQSRRSRCARSSAPGCRSAGAPRARPGMRSGEARSSASCSGLRSSASIAFEIRFVVVSLPATSSSTSVANISEAFSRSPASSAAASAEIRSSRGAAPGGDDRLEVAAQLGLRRERRALILERALAERAHDLVRPVPEAHVVLGRNAEHLGDHAHRQRRGELAHELHRAVRGPRVEQLLQDLLDARAHALDRARRERLARRARAGACGRADRAAASTSRRRRTGRVGRLAGGARPRLG